MNTKKLQEEINRLQSELDRLKEIESAQKKWEPEGGVWYVSSSGIVGCSVRSEDEFRLFGMERPTEELAEKHLARLRNFNTIAAYVDQYAPDYVFVFGGKNYFIRCFNSDQRWELLLDIHCKSPSEVYMPRKIAEQLIKDIESGRVELWLDTPAFL